MRRRTIIPLGVVFLGLLTVIADFLVKRPACKDTPLPPSGYSVCATMGPWLTIFGIAAMILGAALLTRGTPLPELRQKTIS